MKNVHRFRSLLVLLVCLPTLTRVVYTDPPAKVSAAESQFEPLVKKLKTALDLNENQVAEVRKLFTKHAPKIVQLRSRTQAQPYSPQLLLEVENELHAIRDELFIFFNEKQRAMFKTVDVWLIPAPPAFILVNPLPRAEITEIIPPERVIPLITQTSKGNTIDSLNRDLRILHLLNRVTFGPRPGDVERVRRIGINKFLNEQLHPEKIDDSGLEKRLAALGTQRMTATELYQFYPQPQVAEQRVKEKNALAVFGRPAQILVEMQQQKLVRAVSSQRQLLEVMTDFWFNHFNVFANKDADLWLLPSYERDVIRPHALGKFRDLLLAVAKSPAMLYYLDNWLSRASDAHMPQPPQSQAVKNSNSKVQNPKPAQKLQEPGINENYARELMELHTMGVDGGYTQKDVEEVARAFTGWTIDRMGQSPDFVFRPWIHDEDSKTVLGITIPAGGGISDGESVIDILSRHPSTARFIARKLCQRFVSDTPPPPLVRRVAHVFLQTDGDTRKVLQAIFSSPEFNSPPVFRAKIKSPLELIASSLRALDGDTNGAPALHEWLQRMAEPLYQSLPPTGYSEDSSRWMNTGVFLNRLNFVSAVANNQIPGTSYDPLRLTPVKVVGNLDALIPRLAALIVHTPLSPKSQKAIQIGLGEQAARLSNAINIKNPPTATVTLHQTVRAPIGNTPLMETSPAPLDAITARRLLEQETLLLLGSEEFQRR